MCFKLSDFVRCKCFTVSEMEFGVDNERLQFQHGKTSGHLQLRSKHVNLLKRMLFIMMQHQTTGHQVNMCCVVIINNILLNLLCVWIRIVCYVSSRTDRQLTASPVQICLNQDDTCTMARRPDALLHSLQPRMLQQTGDAFRTLV